MYLLCSKFIYLLQLRSTKNFGCMFIGLNIYLFYKAMQYAWLPHRLGLSKLSVAVKEEQLLRQSACKHAAVMQKDIPQTACTE